MQAACPGNRPPFAEKHRQARPAATVSAIRKASALLLFKLDAACEKASQAAGHAADRYHDRRKSRVARMGNLSIPVYGALAAVRDRPARKAYVINSAESGNEGSCR